MIKITHTCDFCQEEKLPEHLYSARFMFIPVSNTNQYSDGSFSAVSTLHICKKCIKDKKLFAGDRVKPIEPQAVQTRTNTEIFLEALETFIQETVKS